MGWACVGGSCDPRPLSFRGDRRQTERNGWRSFARRERGACPRVSGAGDASLLRVKSGWGLATDGQELRRKGRPRKTRRRHERDPLVAPQTRVAPAVVTDGAATQPNGRQRAPRKPHDSPPRRPRRPAAPRRPQLAVAVVRVPPRQAGRAEPPLTGFSRVLEWWFAASHTWRGERAQPPHLPRPEPRPRPATTSRAGPPTLPSKAVSVRWRAATPSSARNPIRCPLWLGGVGLLVQGPAREESPAPDGSSVSCRGPWSAGLNC